jgi:hypothetical protein
LLQFEASIIGAELPIYSGIRAIPFSWIELLQFEASIIGAELPIYSGIRAIPFIR